MIIYQTFLRIKSLPLGLQISGFYLGQFLFIFFQVLFFLTPLYAIDFWHLNHSWCENSSIYSINEKTIFVKYLSKDACSDQCFGTHVKCYNQNILIWSSIGTSNYSAIHANAQLHMQIEVTQWV